MDDTLQDLARHFPVVAFAKRLEDNSRRMMEITGGETLPNGTRRMRTLYDFISQMIWVVDGKRKLSGQYENSGKFVGRDCETAAGKTDFRKNFWIG